MSLLSSEQLLPGWGTVGEAEGDSEEEDFADTEDQQQMPAQTWGEDVSMAFGGGGHPQPQHVPSDAED